MNSIDRYSTFLNTDIRRFEVWAISAIRDVGEWELPAERGTVVLQRDSFNSSDLKRDGITFRHAVAGWLVAPGRPRNWIEPLIVISAWSPSPDRTHATIEMFDPLVAPVFGRLCEALLYVYPEAGAKRSPDPIAHASSDLRLPNTLTGDARKMVELLHDGWTDAQIATKLCIESKTVSNRLSELRRAYGPDVVPYRRRSRATNREYPGIV